MICYLIIGKKHKDAILLGKYDEKCEDCTLRFMLEKCDYKRVLECEEKGDTTELLESIKNFERKRFQYEDEWDKEMENNTCFKCQKLIADNSIRRRVWLALLRIKQVDLDHYVTLVKQGSQAEDYESFLRDVDRTIGYFPVCTIYLENVLT
ncbi:predicted protein [Naegleria gruberi]|uniref:Predicted protein n=1 Tax=Naegleria gruberi TaxID=5762 RepID=D2V4S9_NAEGR|nr:uncharacterized protein NAEGRDRAFT_63895 [Naegleria gruberi]EFC47988.1 predicted protein [Naegleria gruberi]|eukprot:XP_002680732.1 predicted protein [Naegleria gruberi strain NEG-M]